MGHADISTDADHRKIPVTWKVYQVHRHKEVQGELTVSSNGLCKSSYLTAVINCYVCSLSFLLCNFTYHSEGRTQTEGFLEQNVHSNICT